VWQCVWTQFESTSGTSEQKFVFGKVENYTVGGAGILILCVFSICDNCLTLSCSMWLCVSRVSYDGTLAPSWAMKAAESEP
jgi:hypothetical protein